MFARAHLKITKENPLLLNWFSRANRIEICVTPRVCDSNTKRTHFLRAIRFFPTFRSMMHVSLGQIIAPNDTSRRSCTGFGIFRVSNRPLPNSRNMLSAFIAGKWFAILKNYLFLQKNRAADAQPQWNKRVYKPWSRLFFSFRS